MGTLVLVDGSSFVYRAYHALPPLTRRSDHLPIGAVSGFCNMLRKLCDPDAMHDEVTHFAVIFDASSRSFRNDIYPEYKATRPPPPEDLRPQFSLVRSATEAFGFPAIELEGFEADDIIATYTRAAQNLDMRVVIVASDKDLMQLLGPDVTMLDTMKNRKIGTAEVVEKFGVDPSRVIDVQALAGDSTDNIPGVPGIGVKTAALLINEAGDLDRLLAQADKIKQPKRRAALIDFADQARLSRELVTLCQEVEGLPKLEALVYKPYDPARLIAFLRAMEFSTLTRRIGSEAGINPEDIAPDPDLTSDASQVRKDDQSLAQKPTNSRIPQGSPEDFANEQALRLKSTGVNKGAYRLLTSIEDLTQWVEKASTLPLVAFETKTDGPDIMSANLVGFSLALSPGDSCYVALGHLGDDDLFSEAAPENLARKDALAVLKPLLENPSVLKIAHNMKSDWLVMARQGIRIRAFDDTMLLSYVADAGRQDHSLEALSQRWLHHEPIAFASLFQDKRGPKTLAALKPETVATYAAEGADLALRLWMVLKPRVMALGKLWVYERLERPLVKVLARMEFEGIEVDRAALETLTRDFSALMEKKEQEAYQAAGHGFNLGSPRQLGEVLFDELGLQGGRKTKTGAWSTGAGTLETLASEGHELPAIVLGWRQLAKLRSTYTERLPEAINANTQRIHTSFALAATSTGRLSSLDPNLQNIPIRTEEGRKIRAAFVAKTDHVLLCADYSQIELRLLAHIAKIDALAEAFSKGLDVHALTASQVFGVPIEGMDPMTRRRAKAINFGIIYGISPFGLAAQLRISRAEAKDYMDLYFAQFPGILAYMDRIKAQVASQEQVETLFGRRLHFRYARARTAAERAFIERAAINAPVQGSAADIIRLAMTRMEEALADQAPSARMLLQVHDELVFEVAREEVEAASGAIRRTMEQANLPFLALDVPLEVDIKSAPRWLEAH